jgi:hypothetical protein
MDVTISELPQMFGAPKCDDMPNGMNAKAGTAKTQ